MAVSQLYGRQAVGREPPFREEAEEQPLLEAVTRQILVKTLRAGNESCFVKCGNGDSVIVTCSYDL
jgi:hypothetical protein